MASQGGAEDASGPSLFQARSTRHNHFQHDDLVHTHNHNHQIRHYRQHHRLHPTEADSAVSQHIRSPPKREGDSEGPPVVVFQTVSVVHYLDARGAVTSVGTLTSTPTAGSPVGPPDLPDPVAPILSALPAAVSAVLTGIGAVLPSVSFSGLLPDPTDGAPSSTTSAESEATASTSSSETSTSTHLSTTTSAFPSLTGAKNSSSTHPPSLFGNHTAGIFSNHTRVKSFVSSRSTSLWTTPTITNTPVIATAPGIATIDATPSTTVEPAPVPDPQHSSTLPPETRNAVVGGVVGSVAAISLIVLALLYLMKWKRQRGGGIMLLGDGNGRSRGLASPDPGSPGGGGRTMAERTTGAFAIPSALARLSGKRAFGAAPAEPEPQERGFYRVSGRKLVSVLESGGDGYTEPQPQPREHRPHDSVGSGNTSRYRDSNPFSDSASIGTSNNDNPLQLGTPMRPVSGVPIFRDGAYRTPVQQQGPYSADIRSSVFPMTSPFADDADHSITSIASRGLGSRFLEDT